MKDLAKLIFENLEKKMLQAQEVMLSKFTNIRTGIANPKILDKIAIDYYNEKMSLKNISTISVSEGNQINIKPFDNSIIGEISKAILNSDLGITPQDDGQVVKLVFPRPTEDKRKILIKEVDKIAEQAKISIRNIIRQGKKTKLNETDTLEDHFSKDIQNLNNKFIKLVDTDTIKKKNELLKI